MSEQGAPVCIAVVGVGAFGRNHVRVLHDMQSAGLTALTAIVDRNSANASEFAQKYGIASFTDVAELRAAVRKGAVRVDAAVVATPTVHHREVALELLASGIDVLIEKPIAVSIVEAEEIESAAAAHGRIAMVGHLERFNPAVTAARSMLAKPMFFECHRLSIFTPRSLDVDVVLDLMIHDLDVVLSMVPSVIREVRAVGLPVLTTKVDIANVRVEFENGCVANFTASRVSTERVRKLRFFQPHEYLSIDYARKDIVRIQVDEQMIQLLGSMTAGFPGVQIPVLPLQGEGNVGGVQISKPKVADHEPLRAELEEFVRAVRTRTPPLVSIDDGKRALALALEIHAKMEEHRRRAGL